MKETIEEIAKKYTYEFLAVDEYCNPHEALMGLMLKAIRAALSSGPSECEYEAGKETKCVTCGSRVRIVGHTTKSYEPIESPPLDEKELEEVIVSEEEIMKHQINMSPPTDAEKVAAYHYNYMANTQPTPKPSEAEFRKKYGMVSHNHKPITEDFNAELNPCQFDYGNKKANTPKPSDRCPHGVFGNDCYQCHPRTMSDSTNPKLDEKELEDAAKEYATKDVWRSEGEGEFQPAGTVVDPDRRDGFLAGYRYAKGKK
jgi:hypothetical protein